MKRSLKITLISVASTLAAIGGVFGGFWAYTLNYKVTPEQSKIENNTGLVQAHGKSLYDKNGNPIRLRGVNIGNALVQEDWMTAFQVGEAKDENGEPINICPYCGHRIETNATICDKCGCGLPFLNV